MNYWKPRNSALANTLGALVAALTTAAIVLTSAGEYEGSRRVLPTDANARRGGVVTTDGVTTLLPPAAPHDDPELMRLDRANEHHG